MKNTDMEKLSVGTKVYWHDPAGETSGVYEILTKPGIDGLTHEDLEYDDAILLIGNGYNEAEVFIRELEIYEREDRHYADNRKRGKREWKTQTLATR